MGSRLTLHQLFRFHFSSGFILKREPEFMMKVMALPDRENLMFRTRLKCSIPVPKWRAMTILGFNGKAERPRIHPGGLRRAEDWQNMNCTALFIFFGRENTFDLLSNCAFFQIGLSCHHGPGMHQWTSSKLTNTMPPNWLPCIDAFAWFGHPLHHQICN